MNVLYLIQGVFYQRRIFHQRKNAYRFSAFLFINPNNPVEELIGICSDDFGKSSLSMVLMHENEITFTKKYSFENVTIKYKLRKEGDFWVGTYFRIDAPEDDVGCMITKAPEGFLSF